MEQQDKKSELFIANNSSQTRTIEQEVDALEFEGRPVEVTKIKADGWLYPEDGVLLEWGYTKTEKALQNATSYIYEQYRYEYASDIAKVSKEAYLLVDGLITHAEIVKITAEIYESVQDELKAESEAECRAERGPNSEYWPESHPYDY